MQAPTDSDLLARAVVSTIGVRKTYHRGEMPVHALDGVDFVVQRGEYVSIMGPSGSGKTTLFNMIGGLDKPSAGRVFIDEVDIAALTTVELAWLRCHKIGYIFQTFNLIQVASALDNVMLPMIFADMEQSAAQDKAVALLKKVGLGDRLLHKPHQMSGGQQQRVAIARALANSPTILLADEPTGNLDAETGAQIIELLREMNREEGVTVITATHDHKMLAVSDRIAWIRDGRVDRYQLRSEIEIKQGHARKSIGPDATRSSAPATDDSGGTPIVSTRGVKRLYQLGAEQVWALGGVDLDVMPGEYLSIMGPSGSGKSTLFNMIGGLDTPTEGDVSITGKKTAVMDAAEVAFLRCHKIGYIFQTFNLIPSLTAQENVAMPMVLGGMSEAQAVVKARMILDKVGLAKRYGHRPDQLSGGQQQRVAIARALANDPTIILADEPTGNLDLQTGEEIITLLASLRDDLGVTVIAATHDHKMLAASDRVIYLEDGRIVDVKRRGEMDIAFGEING